jgi:hypothetical protein
VGAREVEERVHSWRLLCIFYSIMNDGQHLTYNLYNSQLATHKDQMPPFNLHNYTQLLQNTQNSFKANPQLILSYLNWPQPQLSHDNFDFKIKDLEGLLDLSTHDDTMLEDMRF